MNEPIEEQIFREVAEMTPNPPNDEDPYQCDQYQKFVASMVEHCHCCERNRPCDGVLAGLAMGLKRLKKATLRIRWRTMKTNEPTTQIRASDPAVVLRSCCSCAGLEAQQGRTDRGAVQQMRQDFNWRWRS